jgi:hypothetical protein
MAKRGKREKPVLPREYVLLVTPHVNERTGEKVTLVALRTVTEFVNFRYDLIVQPTFEGRTLKLLIQGLGAPELTLPAMGPAQFRLERKDLDGVYDVVVSKHNKQFDSYRVKVSPAGVTVEEKPEVRFSEIVTRIEDW